MKLSLIVLFSLLALSAFSQFSGGNGSGYTRGTGGGVGQCTSSATLTLHVCDSYTLPSGSQTVTTPGTYQDTIPNLAGCDSLLTLHLTFGSSSSHTLTTAGCDSLTFNGVTYTSSGTYTQFLTNAEGCDSALTLILGINQSSTSTLTQSSCDSFTFHGQTYASSGLYTQTIVNSAGCDSVVTLDLTILPINTAVQQNGPLLTATQAGATYQWIDCNNGNAPIAGATNQSYTATQDGDYAVVLMLNGCVDTSACVNVTGTGGVASFPADAIQVYPNPTSGAFTIALGEVMQAVEITLIDLTGKTIARLVAQHTDVVQLRIDGPAGMYGVEVRSDARPPILLRVHKW